MKNEWAKDAVVFSTQINIGWWERVKVLFGWSISIHVETETEHLPGRVETVNIRISAVRPSWMPRRKGPGAALVEDSTLADVEEA